jgi:LmbE family N-acetylglucosaminyl deacetylase
MSVLVIAPHPDDEVLGAGGMIARCADEGRRVAVVIVTRGEAHLFDPELIERGRREAVEAHALLGVAETRFLDFPAARLDEVPHRELNAALAGVVAELRPETVLVPFRGDVHMDHQLVFDSAMVAVRPSNGCLVREVLAYETLSETNWNAGRGISAPFVPDCFVRIEAQIHRKLRAMATYASQVREFPHERSVEALAALARVRGATVGAAAAEAFITIRRIV